MAAARLGGSQRAPDWEASGGQQPHWGATKEQQSLWEANGWIPPDQWAAAWKAADSTGSASPPAAGSVATSMPASDSVCGSSSSNIGDSSHGGGTSSGILGSQQARAVTSHNAKAFKLEHCVHWMSGECYWGVKCRFLHDPERQGRLPRTCAIRGSATSKAHAAGACGLLMGNGAALSKDASQGTEKEEEEEQTAEEDADEADAADAKEEETGAIAV